MAINKIKIDKTLKAIICLSQDYYCIITGLKRYKMPDTIKLLPVYVRYSVPDFL